MSCRSTSSRLVLLGVLLLGGCAVTPVRLPEREAVAEAPAAFDLSARIGVRNGSDGFSGSLRWRHDGAEDEIVLASPLGQTVARIERSPREVVLDASDRHYVAQDAGDLTERVLGWRLPLEGMPYWVTGHAAPGGDAAVARNEDAGTVHLRQAQWEIEYGDFRPRSRYLLPSRIVMRNGALEVKLVVDEWRLP